MKKLIFILIAVIVNVPLYTYSHAKNTITIPITESDDDYTETPEKGLRMPQKPKMCVIDFETLTIQTSATDNLISYELCDETGDAMIASYHTDYEMVAYMSSQTGVFQLRLVTEGCTYTGYIEL